MNYLILSLDLHENLKEIFATKVRLDTALKVVVSLSHACPQFWSELPVNILVNYLEPIVENLHDTEILTSFNTYLSSFSEPFHVPIMPEIALKLTHKLRQT